MDTITAGIPVGQIIWAVVTSLLAVVWWNLNEKIKDNDRRMADRLNRLEQDIKERLQIFYTQSSQTSSDLVRSFNEKFNTIEHTLQKHDSHSQATSAKIDVVSETLNRLELKLVQSYSTRDEMEEFKRSFAARGERINEIEAELIRQARNSSSRLKRKSSNV